MDYEIIPYKPGMEDYFCSVGPNGEIQDISYIQTYECPTPCIDEDGELLPIEEGTYIINDGFERKIISKEEIDGI